MSFSFLFMCRLSLSFKVTSWALRHLVGILGDLIWHGRVSSILVTALVAGFHEIWQVLFNGLLSNQSINK